MYERYLEHDLKVCAGYLKREEELMQSASGGIATALSRKIIQEGGMVAGVAYKKDFSGAEYILTDSMDELTLFCGTKVIDVETNDIFNEIKEVLYKKRIVLFFGVPCLVKALKNYLKENFSNLLSCELICSGKISASIHREYCEWLEKKYSSKICSFTVRHKKEAWLPEYMKVGFDNGRTYEYPFKKTEYGQAFKILKNEACLSCELRGNKRNGDLMIGDFWGASPEDDFWNKKGVSVIFVQTENGEKWINMIENVYLSETIFEKAVKNNLSVICKIRPHAERKDLMPLYKKKGLFKTMKKSRSMRRIRVVNWLENSPFRHFLILYHHFRRGKADGI